MSDPTQPVDVWRWPIVLGVSTAIALVAGLWGDGAWDVVAWIGLGVPTLLAAWLALRGRSSAR